MAEFLTAAFVRPALPLALILNPFLLVRLLWPRAAFASTVALSGAAAVVLNTAIGVGANALGVAFVPPNLALFHWLLFAVLIGLIAVRGLPLRVAVTDADRIPLLMTGAFCVLVLPLTHLAGIDTYKWQDLAGMILADRRISWVVHPLSLFGFTPRAYPCAQPILLATIESLGGTGVDGGYYLVSVLCGSTGTFASLLWARRLFGDGATAVWTSFLYVFSPVFLRYTHWATGRGLFLALFPLFLLAVADLPRPRAVAAWLGMAVLLAMSHKTGIVAVLLLTAALPLSLLLPRRPRPWLLLPLLLLSGAAAALVASPAWLPGIAGRAAGALRADLTRFGWLMAPALFALAARGGIAELPAYRRLIPALLLAVPLAHFRDMYGALILLPLLAAPAASGLVLALAGLAGHDERVRVGRAAAVVLSLVGAIAVVVHRSADAASSSVAATAAFLDRYDPRGPFRIEAPEPARAQIQAYVSGCPRPVITCQAGAHLRFKSPPPLRGASPGRLLSAWTAYLRNAFYVDGAAIEWYGHAPKVYYVLMDGQGFRPETSRLLFRSDDVELYGE